MSLIIGTPEKSTVMEARLISETNANPTTSTTQPSYASHARSIWRSHLGFGLRTALACGIVGCTTLYSPPTIRRHLTFPAFSYVTVILITGKVTLGDTLRNAVSAMYGTIIGTLPAFLILLIIGDARLYIYTTVLAVTISSFLVALPCSNSLFTKQIAFGQIVIVYIAASQKDANAKGTFIPGRVAACTSLGAVAAILASLLPYPRLAVSEVREKRKFYTETVSERLRLLVDAFFTDDSRRMVVSSFQAKSLSNSCAKLLRDIKLKQPSMQWEMMGPWGFLRPDVQVQLDRLEALEVPLQGMEIALASASFHANTCNQKLKDYLLNLRDWIILRLKQGKYDDKNECINKALQSEHPIPQKLQDLPAFFFLFCMELLYNSGSLTDLSAVATNEMKVSTVATNEMKVAPTSEPRAESSKEESHNKKWLKIGWNVILDTERLIVALKWSLSLALAVLFGVLFLKHDGYWSGITVAITVTPRRRATFKLANARAQGTAMGSVYGVLGSVISHNMIGIQLLALIPWVIFTSYLRSSRMYGDTGGTAAIITAIIIMGRRNYGSHTAFAIARLAETFIGVGCSICVELLLQPTRAATLARAQISRMLQVLYQLIEMKDLKSNELKLNEEQLRHQLNELMKYIDQAEDEPDFWFLSFHTVCYKNLHCSLSKMVNMVIFFVHTVELLIHESHEHLNQENIYGDFEHFRKQVSFSLWWFQELTQVRSLASLEKALEERAISGDLEMGKTKSLNGHRNRSDHDEERDQVVTLFLQHAQDVIESLDAKISGQTGLYLVVVAFCMDSLIRETLELEKRILELVLWENPTRSWYREKL